MTDLAAWLTQIWDEDEARLSADTFCGPVWPTTGQLLARIAADRRIEEWCTEVIGDRNLDTYGEFGSLRDEPKALAITLAVETLRLLALPYVDRPGYQETWRP